MTGHVAPLLWFALCAALPAQHARARLEGECTDAMGRPVPNCPVTVERDGEVLARTHCDASGCFVAAGLPPVEVLVRAIVGTDVAGIALDLATGEDRFAHVVLRPARTLRGVVRTEDGTAVPAAWILAAPEGWQPGSAADASTQSGADGRYELPHVLAGPVTVRAWVPEHAVFQTTVHGTGDETLDCTLRGSPRRSIRFQMLGMSAEQLQGARVHCVLQPDSSKQGPLPPPLRCLRADREGFALLPGWPSSNCVLYRCELADGSVLAPINLDLHDPEWLIGFEPRLDPAQTVRGILVDPQGQPLGQKRISLRAAAGMDDTGLGTIVGESAPDGTFALTAPIERGSFVLRVLERGLAVKPQNAESWLSRYAGGHEKNVQHRVVVATVPDLRLRVLGPAGIPVRSVEALLTAQVGNERYTLGRGISDAAGCIHFLGLDVAGLPSLRVLLTSHELAAVLDRTPDASGDLGDVTLGQAARVEGLVLDQNGKPAVGAPVMFGRLRTHFEPAAGDRFVFTGRDGRFAVTGIPEGTWYCGAESSYFDRGVALTLRAGELAEMPVQR